MALLPFVDEKRLLSALEKVYPDLTDAEREYKKTLRSVILGNSKLNIVLLINLIVQITFNMIYFLHFFNNNSNFKYIINLCFAMKF